ncbi:MAG: 3-oxoacyl-[acyl-carrier-protein] synthase III C-terminal domain-containing protein, partial [Lentisphaeria bacterium]
RFTVQGRDIAARAGREALQKAGLKPTDIGGIVANTCTAYLCPGLTSYLAEDLGLPTNVKAIDIMGMGCGSAIPNLECGCGMLQNTRGKPVLCISTEICSATHLVDDDPGITVSNCIFGDGAAAVVLGAGAESDPCLIDFETGLFPKHREALRYTHKGGRLRNQLTPRVPVIGAQCTEKVVQRLLARHEIEISDIRWWAVHAGGTSVLERVGNRLNLADDALATSTEVFEEYGNMSSPTVLFVLQRLMQNNQVEGPGMLLAFGAGFTAFAGLAGSRA